MNIPSTLFFTHAAFRRNPGFRGIARRKSSHRRRTLPAPEDTRIGLPAQQTKRPAAPRTVIRLHRLAPFAVKQRLDRAVGAGIPQKIGIAPHLTAHMADVHHLRHRQYEHHRRKAEAHRAEHRIPQQPRQVSGDGVGPQARKYGRQERGRGREVGKDSQGHKRKVSVPLPRVACHHAVRR